MSKVNIMSVSYSALIWCLHKHISFFKVTMFCLNYYFWSINETAKITSKTSLPSIRTIIMSLMMVNVVPRTNRENRKVQMGSAILYSGYKKKIIQFIRIMPSNCIYICYTIIIQCIHTTPIFSLNCLFSALSVWQTDSHCSSHCYFYVK